MVTWVGIHTGQNSQGQDENGMKTLLSGSAQVDIHNTTGYVAMKI